MKAILIKFSTILLCLVSSVIAYGQWVSVLDNVTPLKIAISPDYSNDQTVYVLDDDSRILISETGGSNWVTLYQAPDPQDPAQTVIDIVISPNFVNDNAIIMIHKDGTVRISADRGQQWFPIPAPDGTTGIVFSNKMIMDYTLFAITGAFGPVKFYKSSNGGAVWNYINDFGLGGGFYCRLWNTSDTASTYYMAALTDNNHVYVTNDGGISWSLSYSAQVSVRDFVYSPDFSNDQTVFVADAREILKNDNGGNELSWLSMGTYPDAFGIKFAISPGYSQDQTIYAAVDKTGILKSTNGGMTWTDFNNGFGSVLPISIAISSKDPYTLFAGSMVTGGAPDKLWRYQTSSGTDDHGQPGSLALQCFPNPFSTETEISFETASNGHVQLSIYDISGKKVLTLADENMPAGLHRVKLDCTGSKPGPGIYICSLITGDQSQTARLIIK
jgi:photosystem II stability/assembly factor-like uncharacterized protein